MLGLILPALVTLPGPLRPGMLAQLMEAADAQLRVAGFRLRAALAALRSAPPSPVDLVVLGIDAESLELDQLMAPQQRQAAPLLAAMGPWPWRRSLQADLAAWVLERGADRVLFNVVLSQPSRFGAADDRAFVERLRPWRDRVVLAAAFDRRQQQGLELRQLRLPLPLLRSAASPPPGLTALLQSPQGYTEAIPGASWLREHLADFAPPWPQPLADRALPASRPLPRPPRYIEFPGPSAGVPLVPAWRLPDLPDGFWQGRTVLIGVTAATLGDQMETPFGPLSGTQVQAEALASVARGSSLLPLEAPLAALLLLGWGLAVGGVLGRSSLALPSAVRALALVAVILLMAGLAWAWLQLWLPLAALLAMPLLAGSLRVAGQAWQERRERAYLHRVLARRISPALLRDILRDPGPLGTELGGRRCTCVVLFTDLVGFTALSARLAPADLFALLNRYFAAIAAAVIEQNGLLDKFIGDALMAEFGVPRSRGERAEALAAVRAALAMQERLGVLNRELASQGLPPLRQGIGLHVGEVIAGNLGSPERLEFTVVGAAVNVASRLQDLTRRYPDHPILLSAALRELLPDAVASLPLGRHQLKGWPHPLEVHALQVPPGESG
ncbi:adenylate cyclase protein, putative [Cyanobium sp. PCC 7001]|uniref:CHASE2 domain-containing protein n=1 Tax=Cyanobium sp. PCC 7001 TaxID=180281 RepID=UPI00018052FD|nr:adenylate/guanylate cyclase domain-containing protein [Cyanobium sp. PCC 7001]EDY38496.1 adenylate cyclase protein, putative [Cyanobium sp. PCC 7001]